MPCTARSSARCTRVRRVQTRPWRWFQKDRDHIRPQDRSWVPNRPPFVNPPEGKKICRFSGFERKWDYRPIRSAREDGGSQIRRRHHGFPHFAMAESQSTRGFQVDWVQMFDRSTRCDTVFRKYYLFVNKAICWESIFNLFCNILKIPWMIIDKVNVFFQKVFAFNGVVIKRCLLLTDYVSRNRLNNIRETLLRQNFNSRFDLMRGVEKIIFNWFPFDYF